MFISRVFVCLEFLAVDVACGTGTSTVRSCRFSLVRDEIPVVCICTLSLVSATSDVLSPLSAHGVLGFICFQFYFIYTINHTIDHFFSQHCIVSFCIIGKCC